MFKRPFAAAILSYSLGACGDAPVEPQPRQTVLPSSSSSPSITLERLAVQHLAYNMWTISTSARMSDPDLARITIDGTVNLAGACSANGSPPFSHRCPAKSSWGNVSSFGAGWYLACEERGTALVNMVAEATRGAFFLDSDSRAYSQRCTGGIGGGPLYDVTTDGSTENTLPS